MSDKGSFERLYEKVSSDLRTRIVGGEFQIGAKLPSERVLAQQYDVSRPTVREAIIALEIDGLVQVRLGSGVYVTSSVLKAGGATVADIGPFELLEARRAIEPETCAMAAARISEDELTDLSAIVDQMQAESDRDIALSEEADRRFHIGIARATDNSAMVNVVTMLWDARDRSPQYRFFSDKAHAIGIGPRIDEHSAIFAALKMRDPDAARRAMREHLTRVIESLLTATEVQEVERVRATVAERRRRLLAPEPLSEAKRRKLAPLD